MTGVSGSGKTTLVLESLVPGLNEAVITPYDVISQQFVDNLKRLTEQCVLSLDLRDREKALAHAAEPEQYSLNVDPATGEIVEGESEVADNE